MEEEEDSAGPASSSVSSMALGFCKCELRYRGAVAMDHLREETKKGITQKQGEATEQTCKKESALRRQDTDRDGGVRETSSHNKKEREGK